MRCWIVLVSAALVVGCVQAGAVQCEDGRLCPEGTVCATIQAMPVCASHDDVAACDGKQPFDPCTSAPMGICYDGVCLASGCGNGLMDPGEVCDDGNGAIGDGCSSSCRSTEVCGNGITDPQTATGIELCDDGDLRGRNGCTSRCEPEVARWDQLSTVGPGSMEGARMVFDTARRRFVMFGGAMPLDFNFTVPIDDMWEWDGHTGVKVTTVTPPARRDHGMAYDARRNRIVVFGGDNGAALGDTWEWDGNHWLLRTPTTAPRPRSLHAMAYDAARGKIVVFGGRDVSGAPLDDTWEWDGETWQAITPPSSPPGGPALALAYDPGRGRSVLVGGVPSDTWEWDGATWSHVDTPTPASLRDLAMSYDVVGRRMLALDAARTTWSFDGQAWSLLESASGPPARVGAAIATDPISGEIQIYGGRVRACQLCPVPLRDAWRWNGTAWFEVTTPTVSPGAPVASAVGYDPIRGQVVVVANQSSTSETWVFDGTIWTAGGRPPDRRETALAFDVDRNEMILFGGSDGGTTLYSDTWRWDGSSWAAVAALEHPSSRSGHVMAYDVARKRIVLFGGTDGAANGFADTWEWDGAWHQIVPVLSPPGRHWARLAYDPIRHEVVLFGGYNPNGTLFSDTWTWDGVAWTERTPTSSPPARFLHAMEWSAAIERMVVIGGVIGQLTPSNDIWEWDGVLWTPRVASGGPSPRAAAAMWPTRDGDGLIVFGGTSPLEVDPFGELWRLRFDSAEPYEACRSNLDNDGDALVGCKDLDCWASCTPLCPPGAVHPPESMCPADAPRCGDGTCNLDLENCRLCPADCLACPDVCGDFVCDPGETHAACPGDC